MKNLLLLLAIVGILPVFAEHAIVFVHVGYKAPEYMETAISQARLFNPKARIILLSSEKALERFASLKEQEKLELCAYENLPVTLSHQLYQSSCVETSPFWRYTSERFLYLWDLMEAYCLDNVFHLENDNMLYADLESLLPLFQAYYPGIGAVFDNEDRCIPGFVWIADRKAMASLAEYFAKHAHQFSCDMQIIANYRKEYPANWIERLPLIMPEYSCAHSLISPHNHTTAHPESYSTHIEAFHAIFDAAAIGQFLGGIDPIHANNEPGFINESCLFNPSLLDYQWEFDAKGRLVPYACFAGHCYNIINLHIHSKRLYQFTSSHLSRQLNN